MKKTAIDLIQNYHKAFNQKNLDLLLSLLSQNVIHDINEGGQEIGKVPFEKFLKRMELSYDEQVTDVVIFANDAGNRAAAEFWVEGIYLSTDKGLPEAKKQLPVDVARISRRPDSGDDLQLVSGCEETGRIFSF